MKLNQKVYIDDGINPYDGYRPDSIWELPKNYSTYCSQEIDSQCTVPVDEPEKVWRELGRIK
jgi:hypothetical protein